MNATIGDLRYRMKDVLRAIDRGETVTVLYRGKAKAALMPISPPAGTSNKGTPKIADRPRCLASQRAPTARGPL
jgi:antitoxin (DNA-binding transcriptional repressor) of toxin-antitoxin stability system